MIGNRAKIDPHSLRERDSTFLMKRRKVRYLLRAAMKSKNSQNLFTKT